MVVHATEWQKCYVTHSCGHSRSTGWRFIHFWNFLPKFWKNAWARFSRSVVEEHVQEYINRTSHQIIRVLYLWQTFNRFLELVLFLPNWFDFFLGCFDLTIFSYKSEKKNKIQMTSFSLIWSSYTYPSLTFHYRRFFVLEPNFLVARPKPSFVLANDEDLRF